MPWFTSDGTNMYVDVSGAGPPVLLLHEISLDHRQWTPQSEALRGSYQVFRLDWRGHGKSASGPAGHGWAEYAADAHRALVQVGMQRQHAGVVIAHGYACDAALQLGRRAAAALRALVLVAPVIQGVELGDEWNALWSAMRTAARAGELAQALQLLWRHRLFAGVAADPEMERAVRAMQERFSGDWLRSAEADTGPRTAACLHECNLPILVVCGSEDHQACRLTAAFVAARAPSARLVEIAGSGHFPNLEDPEAFNARLRDFLAQLA